MYGLPERNIHCIEDIQIYLDRFSDFGFEDKLKLDFLYFIRKTYKNALISLKNFDIEKIEIRQDLFINGKVEKISNDIFIREMLLTSLYFYGFWEYLADHNKKLKAKKSNIEFIKDDFKNSVANIERLIPQIENEIEYYEKRPIHSNNTTKTDIEEKFDVDGNEIIESEELPYDSKYANTGNIKSSVEKWLSDKIDETKLDINDPYFVKNAKKKFLAENRRKSEIGILDIKPETVRTYISKYKTEFIKENKKTRGNKKQKKL